MTHDQIEYRESDPPDAAVLHALFQQEHWNDFYDPDEVAHHVRTAVHIVSAWDGGELVGYARLDGDGRLWAVISDVLVRADHQGRGIGTELVRRLVARIKEIDPYHVEVEPIGEREIHLYGKFGFVPKQDCVWMEMRTERLTRKIAQVRGEQR